MNWMKAWRVFVKSGFWIPACLLAGIFIAGELVKKKEAQKLSEISQAADSIQVAQLKSQMETETRRLVAQVEKKYPRRAFLVINSSSNEFVLYQNHQVLLRDKCSTGSYIQLETDSDQKFLFKTPKGEFSVQSKVVSPVWRKPDWAFIEEGLPVPEPGHSSRFERGVLGDYALSLGDGYLIHGTLYQRFIGLPVTHGCVRLNDDNLEMVYKTLRVGSKVYIF